MDQKEIWNILAENWNNFRQKPSKEIKIFTETWPPGKILDLGCGNCRNLIPFLKKNFKGTGLDISVKMLEYAKLLLEKNKVKAILRLGDSRKLPFKKNNFDNIIFLASLHHLKKSEQTQSLNELKRVLKKDGEILITVWNKWQRKFIFAKKETYVPWKIKDKTFKRYYYLFNYFELKKLLKNKGFKIVRSGGIFSNNLMFVIKK